MQLFFSYAEQALLISDRFRDQPLTPLETAKHWVKHIAKNKGAPHLRSVAVDLPFYKLYNLDVWAFIFAALLLIIYLFTTFIRMVVSTVLPSSKNESKKKNLKKKLK